MKYPPCSPADSFSGVSVDRKCQCGTQGTVLFTLSEIKFLLGLHLPLTSDTNWCTYTLLSSFSLWRHLCLPSGSLNQSQSSGHTWTSFMWIYSQVNLRWPTLCFLYFIFLKRKIIWACTSLYPEGINPLTYILRRQFFTFCKDMQSDAFFNFNFLTQFFFFFKKKLLLGSCKTEALEVSYTRGRFLKTYCKRWGNKEVSC